ncbi:MAG: hypothetical protein EOM84_04060, partial [Sphingobacteriia bacterium]|nr:hypothetical protein [Sphingobacteriia bacterium]
MTKAHKKEYNARVCEVKGSEEYMRVEAEYKKRKAKPSDPKRTLLKQFEKLKRPDKNTCSAEEMAEYKRCVKERQARIKEAMEREEFVKQREDAIAYAALELKVLRQVFSGSPKRKEWLFSGSLVTDGVAVSLQYERTVTRRVVAKKKRARVAPETQPVEEYDRNLPTVFENTVVLGLDPGRTTLACVAVLYVVDGKLVRRSWRLSRGQYREVSGINRHKRRQDQLYAPLAPAFSELGKEGASLKAVHEDEVTEYMRRCGPIAKQWWGLALKRSESRAAFGMYMGKRRTLDGFFARILREVKKLFPDHKSTVVAYGEAGLTMAPTGKSEVAVPTGGTHKSCQRVFGKKAVIPTFEYNTTSTDWKSGLPKERVYRTFAPNGCLTVGHTKDKKGPVVPEALKGKTE